MNASYFRGGFVLIILLFLGGCACSERKVAQKLDLTPEIIQQSSDLLAADPELGKFPIVVDGFKGAMRLKGQVTSEDQKVRAEKMVWAVRGVRSVENDLKVLPR